MTVPVSERKMNRDWNKHLVVSIIHLKMEEHEDMVIRSVMKRRKRRMEQIRVLIMTI